MHQLLNYFTAFGFSSTFFVSSSNHRIRDGGIRDRDRDGGNE
jgi:hypothetical protein